jgi:hypothetical protein
MAIPRTAGPVLLEVLSERGRQDAKWGMQNHFNYGDYIPIPTADAARDLCDQRHKLGVGSWADIALEEFAEAVEEALAGNSPALRTELIQLAAVCVAWVECIDRKGR